MVTLPEALLSARTWLSPNEKGHPNEKADEGRRQQPQRERQIRQHPVKGTRRWMHKEQVQHLVVDKRDFASFGVSEEEGS